MARLPRRLPLLRINTHADSNSDADSNTNSNTTVQVTVQTNLAGLTFTVDGTTYTSAQTFSWVPGSSHTIATTSPQNGGTGVRYVWSNWTGGGAISHTVAPTTNTTYTANFTHAIFSDDEPWNWWHGNVQQWMERQWNNCFD